MASEKRYPIGSASIVMVFVAVCLTAFASLSLVSAKADLRLSEKTAQAASAYYAADAKAAHEVNALAAAGAEQQGWQREGGLLTKEFPVDNRQALRVSLDSATFRVEEWRVVITQEWEGDDSLDIWVP